MESTTTHQGIRTTIRRENGLWLALVGEKEHVVGAYTLRGQATAAARDEAARRKVAGLR